MKSDLWQNLDPALTDSVAKSEFLTIILDPTLTDSFAKSEFLTIILDPTLTESVTKSEFLTISESDFIMLWNQSFLLILDPSLTDSVTKSDLWQNLDPALTDSVAKSEFLTDFTAGLGICSLLFCSKSTTLKSNLEWVSELKKSDVSDLLVIRMNRLQKQAICSKNSYFHMFLTVFPFFMPKSKPLKSLFAHLLFFKERLERFAPVALYKRATVSDSLTSLFKKEQKCDSLVFLLTKNKRFARKTDEPIINPALLLRNQSF